VKQRDEDTHAVQKSKCVSHCVIVTMVFNLLKWVGCGADAGTGWVWQNTLFGFLPWFLCFVISFLSRARVPIHYTRGERIFVLYYYGNHNDNIWKWENESWNPLCVSLLFCTRLSISSLARVES
jgi:hypothetical protein